MAKRSTKRNAATKGTIEYRRPLVQLEDRGIYRYARIVGHETVTLTQDEFERASQPADIEVELVGAITAARNVAAEKIRSYITPIDRTENKLDDVSDTEASRCLVWHETGRYELREDGEALYKGGYQDTTALQVGDQFVTIIDVGDGPRWYALDQKPPDDVAVALDQKPPDDVAVALAALRAIEHMKVGGTTATFHAFRLGRLLERLNAMQHEAAALKGKQQALRARTAGKTRQLLTPDQQRQAGDEIAGLVAGGMDVEPACRSLIVKYGVSLSTLKRCYRRRGQPSG